MTNKNASSALAGSPSRVLIVYSDKPPIIRYLQNAFARAGIDTDFVLANKSTWFDKWIIHRSNKFLHNLRLLPKSASAFAEHPLAHKNFRSAELERKIDAYAPDLVLLIRGISFNHAALKKAPLLFGWWIEREERVAEALAEFSLFDWYFFMSRFCVESAAAAGHANASFLPHSVDLQEFHPVAGVAKEYDLCFVGNWSRKRQAYLEAAAKISPNIAIYGRKWRRNNLRNPRLFNCVKGTYIDGEELNRLYNASRIVLNVTNWGNGEGGRRSGMNMRVLEVPATGAFLLTDGSRELGEFLTTDTHVATYEGVDDFSARIAYWLERPDECARIAEQGRLHVAAHFSYDGVVQSFVARYRALRATAQADGATPAGAC